jgi:hypothetical protein
MINIFLRKCRCKSNDINFFLGVKTQKFVSRNKGLFLIGLNICLNGRNGEIHSKIVHP